MAEIDQVIDAAKTTLERQAPEGVAFQPMLHAFKGGAGQGFLVFVDTDPRIAFGPCAELLAAAWYSDCVVTVSDAFQFKGERPANSGRGLNEAGTFEQMWERGERENITEVLIVSSVSMTEPSVMAMLAYVRGDDGTITWTDVKRTDDVDHVVTVGAIPDAQATIFGDAEKIAGLRKLMDLGEQLTGVDPQRARVTKLCLPLKMMKERGVYVLAGIAVREPGDERLFDEIMSQPLSRAGSN